MVKIYYSYIDEINLNKTYDNLCNSLPNYIITQSNKYYYIFDRIRYLTGRWLLQLALYEENYQDNALREIKTDKYNRPYIDGEIDFNISHSGNYVVCGFSKNSKVGIDIEEIKKIDLDDFNSVLSEKDMLLIGDRDNSMEIFFNIWTKKEAVAKANGKGLGLPLKELDVHNKFIYCEGEQWNTSCFDVDGKYSGCVAYKGDNKVILKKIEQNQYPLDKVFK